MEMQVVAEIRADTRHCTEARTTNRSLHTAIHWATPRRYRDTNNAHSTNIASNRTSISPIQLTEPLKSAQYLTPILTWSIKRCIGKYLTPMWPPTHRQNHQLPPGSVLPNSKYVHSRELGQPAPPPIHLQRRNRIVVLWLTQKSKQSLFEILVFQVLTKSFGRVCIGPTIF